MRQRRHAAVVARERGPKNAGAAPALPQRRRHEHEHEHEHEHAARRQPASRRLSCHSASEKSG